MTNRCPHCKQPLVDLPSMNKRVCMAGCKREYEWKLKVGQPSLLIKGLVG